MEAVRPQCCRLSSAPFYISARASSLSSRRRNSWMPRLVRTLRLVLALALVALVAVLVGPLVLGFLYPLPQVIVLFFLLGTCQPDGQGRLLPTRSTGILPEGIVFARGRGTLPGRGGA